MSYLADYGFFDHREISCMRKLTNEKLRAPTFPSHKTLSFQTIFGRSRSLQNKISFQTRGRIKSPFKKNWPIRKLRAPFPFLSLRGRRGFRAEQLDTVYKIFDVFAAIRPRRVAPVVGVDRHRRYSRVTRQNYTVEQAFLLHSQRSYLVVASGALADWRTGVTRSSSSAFVESAFRVTGPLRGEYPELRKQQKAPAQEGS